MQKANDARPELRVYFCTFPSRTDKDSFVYSRSDSVNEQVFEVCKINGVIFLDFGYFSVGLDGILYIVKTVRLRIF